MDADRRGWLERVAEAAERSVERLRERDDPQHRTLVRDLEELRDRLSAERRITDSSGECGAR